MGGLYLRVKTGGYRPGSEIKNRDKTGVMRDMKRNEYFTEEEIREQKKRRKIGRRAMALLLAGMMLFSNIPSNVSAVSDNDISMLPDAMVQTEDVDTTADATEGKTVTMTGAAEQPAAAAEDRNAGEESEPVAVDAAADIDADKAGSADIFDNTTITLDKLTLKATYSDGKGGSVVEELTENGTFDLPYNADINMRLDFKLGSGTAVNKDTAYIYKLPDTIRVDVEADHKLADHNGKSIGTVHIAKDGTLSFRFDTDAIGSNTNVNFYVQFEGGFSESLQEEGKTENIAFPTATGDFKFTVNTTDKTDDDKKPDPKDVSISKYGSKIVNINGQNYIEWTVELGQEGRTSLDGVITDNLPTGLTYAEISGYPQLTDSTGGTITTTAKNGDSSIDIKVAGVTSHYHAKVKFCTYYDKSIFGGTINDSTTALVDNTAAFNPDDDTDKGVSNKGTVSIKPDMLKKTGSSIAADGTIEWTVTINAENLDIQGTSYLDIVETGQELVEDSIQITPGGLSTTGKSKSGFEVAIPAGTAYTDTVTIKYKTKVTDFSQGSYKNTGKLKGGVYDVTTNATVPGYNLLKKSFKDFNKITNTFTWEIVVNEEGKTLENVTVTDTFRAGNGTNKVSGSDHEMAFVSASEALDASSDAENGKLVFKFDKLDAKKVITIVTKVKDPTAFDASSWPLFENKASMTSDMNTTPIDSTAQTWQQIKKPDILAKDGKMNGDGTITWTLQVTNPKLTVKGAEITDVLPAGQEYVDGSMRLQNPYYDANPVSVTPTVTVDPTTGIQSLKYVFALTDPVQAGFFRKDFWICYETRTTRSDDAAVSKSYENDAKIRLDFEGDISVTDDARKKLTGETGGVLEKIYDYKAGNQYVDWSVKINEGHYDMSAVADPVITDQLPSYFDYVSGKLYKVTKVRSGNDTQVTETEVSAVIAVMNGKITVQLPNIGSDEYVFKFRTQFNCLAAELSGKTIANTVNFTGTGKNVSDTSDTIKNVSFSSSSAGAVTKHEIRVRKIDAVTKQPLAGAIFKLYLDGSNICIGEATSGADGYAVFEDLNTLTGYALKLVEYQTPDGYTYIRPGSGIGSAETVIKDYDDANLKTDASNGTKYYEITIPNYTPEVLRGSALIQKKDAASAAVLAGVEFGLYTSSLCTEDTLVARRTTSDTGIVTFSGLEIGETYFLREITPLPGYKANNTIYKIDVKTATETEYCVLGGTPGTPQSSAYEITNEKAKASLTLTKTEKDSDPITYLQNAEFSIYRDAACSDRVDTQTTDANGKLTFTDLELGKTYYYRETKAPDGYVLDTTVRKITIGTGTENADVAETVTVTNEKAIGDIVIKKVDDSTVAVPLDGVVFRLLNADDTDYLKDGAAYEVTSDENGIARFKDIPFGNYKVTEITGKTGYKATSTSEEIKVDIVGDNNLTIINKRYKCDICLTKTGEGGELLAGAEIGLFTKDGARIKTATTGSNGTVTFTDIVYGDYYLQELKAPAGYKLSSAKVTITAAEILSSYTAGTVLDKMLSNEKQKGQICLMKTDDAGAALSGAEFTLYDENMVALKTGKTMTAAEASAMGSGAAEGQLYFKDLTYGTYYVQETKAPDTPDASIVYQRDNQVYKVVVDSDTLVTKYTDADGNLQNLTIQNKRLSTTPPLISFKVKKTDAESDAALADAVFELYKNGVATGITAVTNSSGIAYFKRISVETDAADTRYEVIEKTAPAGYRAPTAVDRILFASNKSELNIYADADTTPKTETEIAWAGDYKLTATSEASATIKNTPIKGKIWVTKTGASAATLLKDAEFTLYKADQTTKVVITGLTNPAKTNEKGIAVFENLPCGTYYLKETGAPDGYSMDTAMQKIVISDDTLHSITVKDTKLSLTVSKKAVGGATEVPGASFTITEKDDPTVVLDSWVSTDRAHIVTTEKMTTGKHYILSETKAPAGYTYTNDIEFVFETDGSLRLITTAEKNGQTITVRDAPLLLRISKQDSVTNKNLAGALLGIYDENDALVTSFTTNTSVYQLPAGILEAPKTGNKEYTLKEISAPDGYEIAADIRFAVAADGKIYTVTKGAANQNVYTLHADSTLTMLDVEKKDIYIRKLDAETGKDIAGAAFVLYKGAVADPNRIAEWTSDGTPHKLAAGLFSAGTDYYLKEVGAPTGYRSAVMIKFRVDSTKKIVILEGNSNNVNGDRDTLLVRDEPIKLYLRKQDAFGTLLPGAVLKLAEYDASQPDQMGTVILDAYKTDGSVYSVPSAQLKLGTTYILRELSAPDGFKKADDIIFTVNDNGSITRADNVKVVNNMIVMEDDEAGLGIGKKDLGSDIGLAGSRLQLTSSDDPHFTPITWVSDGTVKTWDILSFTPGCTYTLTELSAPQGYAYADPITFTIGAADHKIYIDGQEAANRTVYIKDGKLALTVSKQATGGSSELAGAKFEILDESGTVVTTFTTEEAATSVDTSALTAPAAGYLEYILHEVTAPDGYELADDIRFAYDRDGKLYLVTEENGTKIYTEKKDLKLTVYDMPKFCVQKVDAEGNALEGAVLEIATQEDDGFTPIRFTTTKDKYYPQGLKADVTYVLSEITPPQGYSVAEPVSFVLKADGSVCIDGVTATDGRQVTMVDKAVTVYVAKKDLSTRKSLKGAKLAIKNEAGETLYSFVSEKEKTTIPGSIFTVQADQNYAYYSLCELEAPEGYGLAESVDFAINRSGQLYLVETDGADKKYTELTDHVLTMYDMAQLSVSKKTENGKYLKGATLKITAEKDTSFEAITIKTDGKPAYFDSSRFTAGTTYVVSETKAPKGYSYATDVKFKLDQDGNVYVNGKKSKDKSIIMTDEKIQVKVAKKDENSHKHLENAELAVKDADGKVLYTFTSMSKEVTLPAKIFTAPQDAKYTYYTLTEVKAPEGYELAKDIRFAIDKNGTLYIRNAKGNYKKAKNGLLTMYDSPTFTSSTSITTTGSGNKVPKTGDQTPLGLLFALCGLSLAGMISVFSALLRRRRRVNRIEKR